jgi:alkylhydroperoxidase family enzyme
LGKLEEVNNWRKSGAFDRRERLALELSERMTYTGRRVTDAFFARLRADFSEAELVELAAAIALENFRSKFNPVFAIESGGRTTIRRKCRVCCPGHFRSEWGHTASLSGGY